MRIKKEGPRSEFVRQKCMALADWIRVAYLFWMNQGGTLSVLVRILRFSCANDVENGVGLRETSNCKCEYGDLSTAHHKDKSMMLRSR